MIHRFSTRFCFALAALFLLPLISQSSAQYPAGQIPGMGAAGKMDGAGKVGGAGTMGTVVPQTELTEQTAKGAIDAYLGIKEKYGNKAPSAGPKKSTAEAFATLDGVNSILSNYGFTDTANWHTTLISVAMAYGFAKDEQGGAMDESMAKIKSNSQIPEALKQQLIGMMNGMKPSDNNLSVVKGLLGDDEYKSKLEQINK